MSEQTPLEPTVDIVPSEAGGSVLEALSAGLPSVPRILLREPESFGGSPIVRPSSEEMPSQQVAARLQLHGEIARGGMGAVLKGRDVDIGRDVAVKVLLETHHDKAEMIQRFIEEAQISGQLQHPGIVPLYELGRLPDSRPYFTMKLVKGKTLATLLAARKTPGEERARFLGIFAQVCQTLAYAHARGVIHRDLKPSNIMVGAFGEVQVMDWGLAKVLTEGGIADDKKAQDRAEVSVIRTQRSEGSSAPEVGSHTQAGTVLGTPAYMAPEQARGDVDLFDERADVFGLGAILCEVLTGLPPYVGKREEIVYKARSAKLGDAFARLEECGADTELIALTKGCLAAELWERPRHAGEVAEQVTAYQQSVAERLRKAELAETEARARAEEESKTLAEAEARLAAERQARRLTLGLAAAVLLTLTLAGGGGLWYQQQVATQRQEAARRQAELGEAVAAALDKVADLRQRARWDEARAVLEQVQQRLGSSGPADLRRQVEQAKADLNLVERLDGARLQASVPAVDGFFDYASAVREYAATFREAGLAEQPEAVEVVAARIRSSAVREQLVAAVDDWALCVRCVRIADEKPVRLAWLLAVARAADPDPWRNRFRDVAVWQNRLALDRLAREADVSELSPQILTALGNLLIRLEADAVPLLTAAQRRYPSDFWLNIELGWALQLAKRWEEAIGYFRAALALRPANSGVYNDLGGALWSKGRVDEAIAEYKKAIELAPKVVYVHNNLGNMLAVNGRVDEAIAVYKKVRELDPAYPMAFAHGNLGAGLYKKGRVDEAIAEYKKAVELDPKVAVFHYNLGFALRDKGRLDEAIAEWKKVIDLDPKHFFAHNALGSALERKGHLDEAIAEYQKTLQLKPKYSIAHINLSHALERKGHLDEAIAECQKAIELDPKNAHAHHNLGRALRDKGRVDEAIAECKMAVKLAPTFSMAHNNLANSLLAKGRLDEAIAEWKKAIDLNPKNVIAGNNLARLEPVAALQNKLLPFLLGNFQPRDNAQRIDLARLCALKKYHRVAAQLYAEAFAAEPKRADDLKAPHRYNAACTAVLAGCGQGEDAKQLDEKERVRWRQQALAWLRSNLVLLTKQADSGQPADRAEVAQRLRHWQRDLDLAGIREAKELAKLPADERQACEKLWADVAALPKKAEEKK